MPEVDPEEFYSLKRQVRALERTVDQQQKQIAKLKRRTSVDPGDPGEENQDEEGKVPRPRVELSVIETLKVRDGDEQPISVDAILQQAAEDGQLRWEARKTVRKWIDRGYLVGDVEGTVKVAKWPPELVDPEKNSS